MNENEYFNMENLTTIRNMIKLADTLTALGLIKKAQIGNLRGQLMDMRSSLEKAVKIIDIKPVARKTDGK